MLASILGFLYLWYRLFKLIASAPTLILKKLNSPCSTDLTILIPAYNEQNNIERCLTSVFNALENITINCEIIVVDDQSIDSTAELALASAKKYQKKGIKFTLIQSNNRPEGELWVGKNWACSCGMESVTTEWVLFLDADVILQTHVINSALEAAIENHVDLLSLAPRLVCESLGEWMVQPIMASLLGLGFPIDAINDPHSKVSFAAGPFMLFRRSAYNSIGGHKSIPNEVVEDLVLASLIKSHGFKLCYLLGLDSIELQMYSNFGQLWEGWCKNWFIGLNRSFSKSILASFSVFFMFSFPWLLLPISINIIFSTSSLYLSTFTLTLYLTLLTIVLHFCFRLWLNRYFLIPLNFWWLMWIGGLIVFLIGPTSIYRTLTGRGWTWKGRSLS